jgi:hypothetical protein
MRDSDRDRVASRAIASLHERSLSRRRRSLIGPGRAPNGLWTKPEPDRGDGDGAVRVFLELPFPIKTVE